MASLDKLLQRSVMLVATNPRLSTNVRVVCADNGVYLDSFTANSVIAADRYKAYKVSPDGLYNKDVAEYWSGTPSEFVYDLHTILNSGQRLSDMRQQVEDTYNSGVRPLTSHEYGEDAGDFRIFAPLWVTAGWDSLPSYFVIYRLPDAAVRESYAGTPDFFRKEILDKCEIVKSVPLKEHSPISRYLYNYLTQDGYRPSCIYADHDKTKPFIISGVSLQTGEFIESPYYVSDNLLLTERTLTEERDLFTEMYRRQGVVASQLLNLEFLFSDASVDDFTMNRYFGVYADCLDDGTVKVFGVGGHGRTLMLDGQCGDFPDTALDSLFFVRDKYDGLHGVSRTKTPERGHIFLTDSVEEESVTGKKTMDAVVGLEPYGNDEASTIEIEVTGGISVYTTLSGGVGESSTSLPARSVAGYATCSVSDYGENFASDSDTLVLAGKLEQHFARIFKDSPVRVTRVGSILTLSMPPDGRRWWVDIPMGCGLVVRGGERIDTADNPDTTRFFFNPKKANGYLYRITDGVEESRRLLTKGSYLKSADGGLCEVRSVADNGTSVYVVTARPLDKGETAGYVIYSEYIMPYGRLDVYPVKSFDDDAFITARLRMREVGVLNAVKSESGGSAVSETLPATPELDNVVLEVPDGEDPLTLSVSAEANGRTLDVSVQFADCQGDPDAGTGMVIAEVLLGVPNAEGGDGQGSGDTPAIAEGYSDLFPAYLLADGKTSYDEYERYADRATTTSLLCPVQRFVKFAYEGGETDVRENPLMLTVSPTYGQTAFCNTMNTNLDNVHAYSRELPYLMFDADYPGYDLQAVAKNNYSMIGLPLVGTGGFPDRRAVIEAFGSSAGDMFRKTFWRVSVSDGHDEAYVAESLRKCFSVIHGDSTMFRGTCFTFGGDDTLDGYLFSFAVVPERVENGRNRDTNNKEYTPDVVFVRNDTFRTLAMLLFVKASVGDVLRLPYALNRTAVYDNKMMDSGVGVEGWMQVTGRDIEIDSDTDGNYNLVVKGGRFLTELLIGDMIWVSRNADQTDPSFDPQYGNLIKGRVVAVNGNNSVKFEKVGCNPAVPAREYSLRLYKCMTLGRLYDEFDKVEFSEIYNALHSNTSPYMVSVFNGHSVRTSLSSSPECPMRADILLQKDNLRNETVVDGGRRFCVASLIQRQPGRYVPVFSDVLTLFPDGGHTTEFLPEAQGFGRLLGRGYTRGDLTGALYGFRNSSLFTSSWDADFLRESADAVTDVPLAGGCIAEDVCGMFLSRHIKLPHGVAVDELTSDEYALSFSETDSAASLTLSCPLILERRFRAKLAPLFARWGFDEYLERYCREYLTQRFLIKKVSLWAKTESGSDTTKCEFDTSYMSSTEVVRTEAGLAVKEGVKATPYDNLLRDVTLTLPVKRGTLTSLAVTISYSLR